MTWRNGIYPPLANLNAGFEMVVEALHGLKKACILDDPLEGSLYEELSNLWDGFNYVILTGLYIRESANQGENNTVRDAIEKVLEKLRKRGKPQPKASAPQLLPPGDSIP